MFAQERLKELAERRRLLVLEADLHRSLINLERETLRARLTGLEAARERVSAGGPWLVAGSAVAGLFAVRHWRTVVRWLPTAWSAWRWMKSLKAK
jgi:hypothetical protein